jgi:hypothetical protein
MSGTGGAVTNTTTTFSSGRLFSTADKTALDTAKGCTGACTTYFEGDVSLLPAYYVWETGPNPWNQISYLMSQAATPILEVFDAPLQVSYLVPANTDLVNLKPYGNFAGSTITLQYGGFGDLWGIPNECIDITTNTACVFSGTPTAPNNQRWTSKFSIPFDTTNGIVTVPTAQGTVTAGTQYLVKALDKEVRLAKVPCTGTGLSTTSVSNTGLPTTADFVNPTATVGAKPTVTAAPQVIHGVKQY